MLNIQTSATRSFLIYTNMLFVNNVAPFSVLGAEPLAALLVSRTTDASYDRSFAAVASVDVVNFLPAPAFALLGLLYFLVTATLGKAIEVVILSLLAVFVLFVIGGYVGWHRRYALETRLIGLSGRIERLLARFVPGLRVPNRVPLERRFETVIESLEAVAADRRALGVGLICSATGWVLMSLTLWLALDAVGAPVPIEAPLFIVPLATVTDLVPLPGGVGSVDAALILLLVATTGVPAPTATAAVLIHRGATFLLPVVLGGATTVVLQGLALTPE